MNDYKSGYLRKRCRAPGVQAFIQIFKGPCQAWLDFVRCSAHLKSLKRSLSMSLDRSLKGKSTLERHRNVLRRSERIALLEDNEKWTEGKGSVFGLVKVGHRKQAGAKKAAKTEEAG